MSQDDAATKIQAQYRGSVERKDTQAKNEAATKIQSQYRAKVAREDVELLKDETQQKQVQRGDPSAGGGSFSANRVYVPETQYKGVGVFVRVPSKKLNKTSFLKQLNLDPKYIPAPILLVIGDLASLQEDKAASMRELYKNGILRAAAQTDAMIVDCGLASGICSAEVDEDFQFAMNVPHMGITPNAIEDELYRYHTHQVRVTDFIGWDDRQEDFVDTKLELISRLTGPTCRVVCVLINNGHVAWEEALQCTQRGWPVIIVKGSGDLADELVTTQETGQCYDFNMREIISTGKTVVFSDKGTASEFSSLLHLHLSMDVIGCVDRSEIWWVPEPRSDDEEEEEEEDAGDGEEDDEAGGDEE